MTDEQIRAAFKEAYPALEAELALGENNQQFHGLEDLRARHAFAYFKRGARAIEAELSKQEPVARPRLPRIDHFAREAFEKFASGVECELTNYRWFEAGWDARGDTVAAAPLPSAPAQSITDYMMDLVDRLGHETENVDPKAWQHLLVYAPKPSASDTVQVPDPKPRWFDI